MRLAFIGGYGHHYLRGLLRENLDLDLTVAVAGDGHDTPAAQNFAALLENPPWFESPPQLFDEFRPDVISLGGVLGYNGDIAASALERDIAVVCDKPVAATWEQLARLREVTQNTNRVLLTEFPFRSRAEFRAARQAVQDGLVGEVMLASAQKSYRFGASRPPWYANRAEYTGTMLWVASHGIDVVEFCGGQPLGRVVGASGNLSRPEYGTMEEFCVAMFELGNGGTGLVHADFLRPQNAPSHGDDRLRIAGGRGVVEVQAGRCLLISGDAPEQDITDSVTVRPVHLELLAGTRGESEFYSTVQSLATAENLLRARDAADERAWKS